MTSTTIVLPQGNVLDIVTDRNVLRRQSETVGTVDAGIVQLAADMLATMYAEQGIGLAAVQVGRLVRVIVFDASPARNRPEIMIDPEIVWSKKTTQPFDEGCLSLPGHTVAVHRPTDVEIAYTDIDGQRRKRSLGGLPARVAQHEIDHTNGVIILDKRDAA